MSERISDERLAELIDVKASEMHGSARPMRAKALVKAGARAVLAALRELQERRAADVNRGGDDAA